MWNHVRHFPQDNSCLLTMHLIHSAQWPALAPRILTAPSRSFGVRSCALGSPQRSSASVATQRARSRARGIRGIRGRGRSFCFELAGTAGVCRWITSAVRRRRLSTVTQRAAPVQSQENLGTIVSPSEVASPDAPVTGVYDTIRSAETRDIPFTSVKTLGEDGIGPAIGDEVWIRARVATVRVKGKSTFVVLRENSLYTVQACKFKEKEDGGESATAVARFFKSIPLDPELLPFGMMQCIEVPHHSVVKCAGFLGFMKVCRKASLIFAEFLQRLAGVLVLDH